MANYKKPSFGGDKKKSFGDKPRFGNKKFNDRPSGGRQGFSKDQGERKLFKAVCDSCHKDCEVPFQPSGDKPVLCGDCFKSSGDGAFGKFGRDSGRPSFDRNPRDAKPKVSTDSSAFQFDKLKKQLENIERKLDALLLTNDIPKTVYKESSDELKQALGHVMEENSVKDTLVKAKKPKIAKKVAKKEPKKKSVAKKTEKKVVKKK